jgi:hypothetical protein
MVGTTEYIFLLEMKQGKCICPLSWSVHCTFTGDGKCSERGWACTHTLILTGVGYFSIMIECTPESDCCYSVYSVVVTTVNWTCNQSLYTVTSKLERGEMSEEGATFLSYWKGTTLNRVKDKASHCYLERKTIETWERQPLPLCQLTARGDGAVEPIVKTARKCRLPLLYLFHGAMQVKQYQNTTSHSTISLKKNSNS